MTRRANRLYHSKRYSSYLRSPAWNATKKARILKTTVCDYCKRPASRGNPLDLHHTTYERLGHELPTDLEVVCRSCHDGIHGASRESGIPIALAGIMAHEEASMHVYDENPEADAEAEEWLKYRQS